MGVTKQQENIVGTPIRTQIIVIFHCEYKSLQQSQNWDKPKFKTQSCDKIGVNRDNSQTSYYREGFAMLLKFKMVNRKSESENGLQMRSDPHYIGQIWSLGLDVGT